MVRPRGHCRCRAADTGRSNLEEEKERKWNHNSQRSTNDWFGSMRNGLEDGWTPSATLVTLFPVIPKSRRFNARATTRNGTGSFSDRDFLGMTLQVYICMCLHFGCGTTYIHRKWNPPLGMPVNMICCQGLLPVITASFAKLSCMRITKNLLRWTGWVVTVPY
jgi:hypothetical protein